MTEEVNYPDTRHAFNHLAESIRRWEDASNKWIKNVNRTSALLDRVEESNLTHRVEELQRYLSSTTINEKSTALQKKLYTTRVASLEKSEKLLSDVKADLDAQARRIDAKRVEELAAVKRTHDTAVQKYMIFKHKILMGRYSPEEMRDIGSSLDLLWEALFRQDETNHTSKYLTVLNEFALYYR